MSEHVLTAEVRERAGKGAARATRRAGRVPAVLYGGKETPLLLSLDYKELSKELSAGGFFTKAYDIKVGKDTHKGLARDLQQHPVTDVPLHVDFLRLAKGATVNVDVTCNFINEEESPGIKRGGVLNVVRYDIELICPVDAIPQEIIVDLEGTDIGDSIHISEITLPEGVTPAITDRDFTVATIAAPSAMKQTEEEEEEEEIEGEEGEIEEEEEAEEEE